MTIKSQDDLNQPETHSTEVLLSTIEELERTKEQLNKIGEQFLSMIDLLQKCYFYLSAAKDCKLTLEHCGNISILCELIEKQFKELEK
jgi:ABC-type dipeptide/oligopeptide/nickel transport system ATPase component